MKVIIAIAIFVFFSGLSMFFAGLAPKYAHSISFIGGVIASLIYQGYRELKRT